MRIGLVPIPILLLGILLLLGCGAAKETDPERLVPAGSTVVGKIRVAEILKDADLAALFESIPKGGDDPQTVDDALDQAFEEIGVDIRQFSDVVFFGDLSRVEEGKAPDLALIAPGSFDEDELVAAIEEAGELSLAAREYKGHKIYSDNDQDVVLSVLGGDVLVIGTTAGAVRSVIDVREGDKERASGRVYEAFNDLGDVLIRVALELPPEAKEELPFGGFPVDIEFVRDIEVLGVAADKAGGTLKLKLRGDFSSEESAADAGDALDALLKLAKIATKQQEERRLLDNIKVSAAGKRMTALLDVSVGELTDLVSGLEEGLPGLLFGIQREEIAIEALRPEIRAIPVPVTAVPRPVPQEPSGLTGKRFPEMADSSHIPVGETATYSTVPSLPPRVPTGRRQPNAASTMRSSPMSSSSTIWNTARWSSATICRTQQRSEC